MNSKDYGRLSVIPFDTEQAALNSFNEETFYIRVGNSLETILQGLDSVVFEYPLHHFPIPAYVFALITIFQRREELTDADMAAAVRTRPEVRYALRLPLRHPNVPVASLCRYRQLLYSDPISFDVFEQIANRLADLFRDGMDFVSNSSCKISESVCLRNRTNSITTRMLEVLEALAATYPDWMRKVVPTYWYDRYHRSAAKFVKMTLDKSTLEMILAIGKDMKYVLQLAEQEQRIADLQEVQTLGEVFYGNFDVLPDGKIQWKATMCSVDLQNTLKNMDAN